MCLETGSVPAWTRVIVSVAAEAWARGVTLGKNRQAVRDSESVPSEGATNKLTNELFYGSLSECDA